MIAQKIACDFLSDLRSFFSPSAVENCLRFSTAEERLLRFLRNRRRSVFSNSFGIRENSFPLLEKKNPRFFFSPSAVENRLRFSTADEGPFSWSFFPDSFGVGKKGRIFPDSDTFYYSWSFFFQKKDGFSPNSRVFFLCPCGAEGIKSCLSFRFQRNRKNGRPLRFLWNLRGPGVGGNIGIVKNSPFFPYGKKEPGVGENIRKRTGFPRLLRSRGKYRREKSS